MLTVAAPAKNIIINNALFENQKIWQVQQFDYAIIERLSVEKQSRDKD